MDNNESASDPKDAATQPVNPPNKKINYWKISFFIVLLLLIITSVGFVYYTNSQMTNSTNLTQTKELENNVPSPQPTQTQNNEFTPVIVYEQPADFTESDKADIDKKVIQPFFDYYNADDLNYIAMVIKKDSTAEPQYQYSFFAIYKTGGTQGSVIFKENGQFKYWAPTCQGPCEYTQSYIEKYPEVVSQTNL